MSITITGNDVQDVRRKLAMGNPQFAITILWRRVKDERSFNPPHLNGCIIDATRCNGVEVPMSFDTDAAAVRYFAELLKAHSSWIKQEEKEEKAKTKESKK